MVYIAAMAGRFFSASRDVRWSEVLKTGLRLLTFRATQLELIQLNWKHLVFGVCCTWLVGIGRYWDNPRVGLLQHLGVGSVVYIFILATFLWLIVYPLRPQHWNYLRVLTFISLVSPPALLYAVPVERFLSLPTANSVNAWFLAVVAIWRVALLLFFLRRLGELDGFSAAIATLFPLTLIVTALTVLNLERVVFNFMGGIRQPSGNDSAYEILTLLTVLSIMLFIPLVICYLVVAAYKFQTRRDRPTSNNGKSN